jgi:hypothetical protein
MERREWRDADEALPPPYLVPGPIIQAAPLRTVETQLARAAAASIDAAPRPLSLPAAAAADGGGGGLPSPPPNSLAIGAEVEVRRRCTVGLHTLNAVDP